MTRWLLRILLSAAILLACWYLWGVLFPGPERIIRKQLSALAQAATIRPNETPLAKAAAAQRVASFFTTDAEVVVNIPGQAERTFDGRQDILEAAMAARAALESLEVEFLDPQVTVEPGSEKAQVLLTLKAVFPRDKNFLAQELAFFWRKTGRQEWRIERVETRRTLL